MPAGNLMEASKISGNLAKQMYVTMNVERIYRKMRGRNLNEYESISRKKSVEFHRKWFIILTALPASTSEIKQEKQNGKMGR